MAIWGTFPWNILELGSCLGILYWRFMKSWIVWKERDVFEWNGLLSTGWFLGGWVGGWLKVHTSEEGLHPLHLNVWSHLQGIPLMRDNKYGQTKKVSVLAQCQSGSSKRWFKIKSYDLKTVVFVTSDMTWGMRLSWHSSDTTASHMVCSQSTKII